MPAVGGYGRLVTATKTIAAAGNYTAGDVLSESASNGVGTYWTFSRFFRPGGSPAYITDVRVKCSVAAVTFQPAVHLFTIAPTTSEQDDNAARAITAADKEGYKGSVELAALATTGTGGFAFTSDPTIRKMISPYEDGSSLYAILETLDDETNETASMTITIEIEVEQL
jgi:hypothetical protein